MADNQTPEAQGEPVRVDFYVLEEASSAARLKLACKLAEKAYLASQRVLIWHTDAPELQTLDELLWTFSDRSFVPHETLKPGDAPGEAPVLLAAGTAPAAEVDLVINLAPDLPPGVGPSRAPRRLLEIIDGDETRRRLGRARWSAYRDLGFTLTSHNVKA
jgi:DNA polymerase-3 subunit chi